MKKTVALFFVILVTASSVVCANSVKATPPQKGAEVKRVNETIDSKKLIQQEQSEPSHAPSNVRSRIEQLLKNGRAMEQYRNTSDHSAMRACGEIMRENQPKAESVRLKAKTLPRKYFNLKVASIEVIACVSCSDDAIEDCERVAESLANVE